MFRSFFFSPTLDRNKACYFASQRVAPDECEQCVWRRRGCKAHDKDRERGCSKSVIIWQPYLCYVCVWPIIRLANLMFMQPIIDTALCVVSISWNMKRIYRGDIFNRLYWVDNVNPFSWYTHRTVSPTSLLCKLHNPTRNCHPLAPQSHKYRQPIYTFETFT